MKEEDKDKQPLMSGIDILKAIESILIFALLAVACFSLYAVVFKGAMHQLIIAVPCVALAITLLWHQTREKEDGTDA